MGVDVIVTDHHSMPDTLPDAYAIVPPDIGTDYPSNICPDAGGFQAGMRSFKKYKWSYSIWSPSELLRIWCWV